MKIKKTDKEIKQELSFLKKENKKLNEVNDRLNSSLSSLRIQVDVCERQISDLRSMEKGKDILIGNLDTSLKEMEKSVDIEIEKRMRPTKQYYDSALEFLQKKEHDITQREVMTSNMEKRIGKLNLIYESKKSSIEKLIMDLQNLYDNHSKNNG
jgi:uncharacterized protein involved in exopolysaccharide biosynthesis